MKTAKEKTGKAAVKGADTPANTGREAQADAQAKALAKELRDLIPKLDSEGLAFLVEQAKVHLYNMRVDELNKAQEADDAAASRTGKAGKGTGSAGSGRVGSVAKPASRAGGRADKNFRIDGTESGSSYYLHYGNNELMFSRNEMIHLVKMVNAGGTDLEIRERLYNWFEQERRDAFSVIPMKNKFDEHLKALVAHVKKNFKLRS